MHLDIARELNVFRFRCLAVTRSAQGRLEFDVIRPLLDAIRPCVLLGKDEEVIKSFRALSVRWRRRVLGLAGSGCRHFRLPATPAAIDPRRVEGALNCCPSVTVCVPRARCCRLPWICPYCRSRYAKEVWERAERLFFPTAGPSPYDIVRAVDSVHVAPGAVETLQEAVDLALARSQELLRRVCRQSGVAGLAYAFRPRPLVTDAGAGLELERRFLFAVDPTCEDPGPSRPHCSGLGASAGWATHRFRKTNLTNISRACAWAYACDPKSLTGPALPWADLSNCLKGRRLQATLGDWCR